MLRLLSVAALSLALSGAMACAANGIPRLEVSKTCRGAYKAFSTTTLTTGKQASRAEVDQAYKTCMESQDAARKSAAARWTRVKAENRRTCASMAGALFPSYVELDACLQMYDDKDPQMGGGAPAATTATGRKK